MDERIRLPQDQTVGDLTPAELLGKYWQASHTPEEDVVALQELVAEILHDEAKAVEEGAEEAEEMEVKEESRKPITMDVPAK